MYMYKLLIQTSAGSRFLNKPEHNKLNLGSSFPITKQRLKSWGCWRFSSIWPPYQVFKKQEFYTQQILFCFCSVSGEAYIRMNSSFHDYFCSGLQETCHVISNIRDLYPQTHPLDVLFPQNVASLGGNFASPPPPLHTPMGLRASCQQRISRIVPGHKNPNFFR